MFLIKITLTLFGRCSNLKIFLPFQVQSNGIDNFIYVWNFTRSWDIWCRIFYIFHGLEKLDLYIPIHEAKWEPRPNHYASVVNDDNRGADFEGSEGSYIADISDEGYATPAPVHKPAPAYQPYSSTQKRTS